MAVHSTRLGQALGGARLWRYGHWTDALADALRLSQAMTMKNAAAGLARGGGKSVVCIPAGVTLDERATRDAMLDLGDAVESLGGAYMTAEDVGTSAELMAVVHERTEHVCGLPAEQGGVGEPADATAAGVHASILATLDHVFGSSDVAGRHFVVAGLGQVGGRLARSLAAAGARLTVTDVAESKRALADELGAAWVEPGEAHLVEADVFVPCGLGGVLTHEVVDALRVRAVVGAANNQLASRDVAGHLTERRHRLGARLRGERRRRHLPRRRERARRRPGGARRPHRGHRRHRGLRAARRPTSTARRPSRPPSGSRAHASTPRADGAAPAD